MMEKFWELAQPYYQILVKQVIVDGYRLIAYGVIFLVLAIVCVWGIVKLANSFHGDDAIENMIVAVLLVGVFGCVFIGVLLLSKGVSKISNPEYYTQEQLFCHLTTYSDCDAHKTPVIYCPFCGRNLHDE